MLRFFKNLTRKQFVEVKAPSGQRQVMSHDQYVSKVIEEQKPEMHLGSCCTKPSAPERRIPDFDWVRWL